MSLDRNLDLPFWICLGMFESLKLAIVGVTNNGNCGVLKMYENYEEIFSIIFV